MLTTKKGHDVNVVHIR